MTSRAADRDVVDAACPLPRFADVPPGLLPESRPGRQTARTSGFSLAVTPTTVGQYWHYLAGTGVHVSPDPRLCGFPEAEGLGLRSADGGRVVFDRGLGALPVTCVTWHGAVAYSEWLSVQIEAHCRLPSAAEWHYAAAGPEGLRWALGDEFDRETYAPGAEGPRPVAEGPPTTLGLYDMTGNVFEWCLDPLEVPGAAVRLASRVIKGGAYTVRNPESFESSTSFTADELSALPYIGFRVLSER